MKRLSRGASCAAIAVALTLFPAAWAQQTPTQTPSTGSVDQTAPPAEAPGADSERVVVTGSFIQGTPEDTALPVEVFSADDLEKQGSPTVLEFVKQLSISGDTGGDANYFGQGGTANVTFNLRGLGSDKTLTLLNGRRMSQNTSNMPSAAIGRIEVLKDGAAVIYGADATGGVVNFITRDDFVGFQADGSYKLIDGSDGDYEAKFLAGFGDGQTNFMVSGEWEHRSRLETEDRGFSSLPYGVNPASWSTTSNLTTWTPRGALPGTMPSGAITAAQEFGPSLGAGVADFTQASCEAVGGIYRGSSCSYNYISYYNMVEELDIYRLYAQLNTAINDHIDFHIEASYGQVKIPKAYRSPSQPLIRGASRSGVAAPFYVPVSNPYVAEFVQRTGYNLNPAFANTQGFTAGAYRPFGHNGNAAMGLGEGYGVASWSDDQSWRISSTLKGTLGDSFGALSDIGFDFAVTYNQSIEESGVPDTLAYRLQEAMNGFGGPSCSAADLDQNRLGTQNPAAAGKNGCLWWNPFASSFANQPELGLANPNYVPGNELPAELVRWAFDSREGENIDSNLTVDLVFNGQTGLSLPGGDVGWAAGGQWRQTETREQVTGDLYNGNTPCAWPTGQTPLSPSDPNYDGCTPDRPGPFIFFGINPPDYTDQQQYSLFGELSLPLLDTLKFQAAVRREEFSGGLGATVYKISGKWDVWGPFSLRGSYGTNYQAPAAGLIPGEVTNGVASYGRALNAWLGAQTVTATDISPETAKVWNVGGIWQSSGFTSDSDFSLIVDYFDIQTVDEFATVPVNDIANAVIAAPVSASVAGLANCSHPLVSRITFINGCVQGTTRGSDLLSVRSFFGNGPGQHTNGIDIQADYTVPAGPGDLSLGMTATRILTYDIAEFSLDGFEVSPAFSALGYRNYSRAGGTNSEWRANAHANYNWGDQNFRLTATFVSGVEDDRGPGTVACTPLPACPNTDYGVNPEDWLVYDFSYQIKLPSDFTVSATVQNILDTDPPGARLEMGYDSRIGNPLGRTFEIGLRKEF